jgi:hypothetical protein
MRPLLALGFVASSLSVLSVARADGPPSEAPGAERAAGVVGGPADPAAGPQHVRVVFKRGGSVRGVVEHLTMGSDVVIKPDGESALSTVPWGDIKRVDHLDAAGNVAGEPPSAPGAAPALASGAAPVSEPGVGPRVHITAMGKDVGLYRFDLGLIGDEVPHGELVCAAPCNKRIGDTIGKLYVFGGPGLSSSGRFELETHGDRVDAHVEAGSRTAKTAGIVFISIGGGVGLTGAALIAYGAVLNGTPLAQYPGTAQQKTASALLVAGGALAGVGGAMLLGGLIALGSGVTTYDIYDRTPAVTGLLPAPSGAHVSGSF